MKNVELGPKKFFFLLQFWTLNMTQISKSKPTKISIVCTFKKMSPLISAGHVDSKVNVRRSYPLIRPEKALEVNR